MGVNVHALSFVGGTSARFAGWTGAFSNAGTASAGKNNILGIVDSDTRRYAGFRFPATSVNLLESSTKANPLVWSVPSVLPAAALGINDLLRLPNVSPDTLLVPTIASADGRLYKFVLGTGFTNLNFPDSANSDQVSVVSLTGDPDLVLVGNMARSTAGAPNVYTLRLSTVTWTKVGGNGASGWTFTQNNGNIGAIQYSYGVAFIIVGAGTANGLQVWRSNSTFTTWTQIGGNSLFQSWATGTKRGGYLAFGGNGRLYAGIGGGTAGTDPEAWECANPNLAAPSWQRIGNVTTWGSSATVINASNVASLGNHVVFGLTGTVAGDGEVWDFDTSTRVWTQLGVGAFNRTSVGQLYVSPFNQELFTGVGNNSTGTANLFEAAAGPFSANGGGGFQFQLYKVRV